MRLLLDTHILLWFLAESAALPPKARTLIENGQNQSFVSAVSIWEIAIKAKLGRLNVEPERIYAATWQSHFTPVPFTCQHALAAGALPLHHQDPFDRALMAQALHEPFHLLTHDDLLLRYGPAVLYV